MQFNEFFPVCVLQTNIPTEVADAVEAAVVPELHKLTREKNINDSIGEGYTAVETMSTDFWENKIPVHELVPDFFEYVQKAVFAYQDETSIHINPDFKIRYWTQDYVEHDSHDVHMHGIHGISGTYYVRSNQNAGPIRFYNPNPLAEYVRAGNPGNKYIRAHNDIYPEKSLLLIFPSYIKHKVLQSSTDTIRTSISFDICPGS